MSSLRAFQLSSLQVFDYSINRNCFGDLNVWCEGRFLEVDHPTPPPPPPTSASPTSPPTQSPFLHTVQAVRAPCSQYSPPTAPLLRTTPSHQPPPRFKPPHSPITHSCPHPHQPPCTPSHGALTSRPSDSA